MPTVVLVDDHQLFREGLRALIELERDLRVVGEAGDARAAYDAVEAFHPDLVVLDMSLPGSSGVTVARELRRRNPREKILALSAHLSKHHVTEALDAGVLGYASKDQSAVQILEAMRQVADGVAYLAPDISKVVLDDYVRRRRGDRVGGGPIDALSTREKEVFELLVRGFANAGIATQLSISRRTVETHRAHILAKLGVHSIAEVFLFAAQHGLIQGGEVRE